MTPEGSRAGWATAAILAGRLIYKGHVPCQHFAKWSAVTVP